MYALALLVAAVEAQVTLTGTVVYRNHPEHGVEADVWAVRNDCGAVAMTRSGVEGRFTIPDLPPGAYQVYANSSGVISYPKPVQALASGEQKLVLEMLVSGWDTGGSPSSRPWGGSVIDRQGRPLRGAKILFRGRGGTEVYPSTRFEETATSNDAGKFCLVHASGDRGEIRVTHPDFRGAKVRVRYRDPAGPLTIRLRR